MQQDSLVHAEAEKVDSFLAVLLSEQIGPVTDLQLDFLTSIRSSMARIVETIGGGERRLVPTGE